MPEIIGFALLYAVFYLFLRGVGIVNARANREEEWREYERAHQEKP